jgi:biopolymer transport protein ExbB
MNPRLPFRSRHGALAAAVFVFCSICLPAMAADDWWDKAWGARKPFAIDTTTEGGAITEPVGDAVVLIRLHQGNFSFGTGREDGSDIRFVAADKKTLLPYHIEKWDTLMLEGFVWVRVPDIEPGAKTDFWMYFANPEPTEEGAPDPAATFPEDVALAYHFTERNTPPQDATANANNALTAGTQSEGAIIGSGLRLLGADPVEIPGSELLTRSGDWAWSAWVKPSATDARQILLSRTGDAGALRVVIEKGVPAVEVTADGSTNAVSAEEPVAAGAWSHLTAVIEAPNTVRLFVNGKEAATGEAVVPSIEGPLFLGGDAPAVGNAASRFVGEMDEMQIARVAPQAGAVALAAVNQSGSEAANRLLTQGDEEGGHVAGHNETLEHVMLFGDIAGNMMFDGWIAVGICIIMIIIGWSVGIAKFFYLAKLHRGNEIFFRLWKEVTADLNLLDENSDDQLTELARKMPRKRQVELKNSPLYHIYHAGLKEIESRIGRKAKVRMEGLSGRSMQAIRASMDAGLVRENQRLNNGLVFLTIGIAGGPYVGLLGTVVGVMITFALIAKTGEVEVNSIAPGIASALLATVAGLVVAIPALFIYSYLSGRIKNTLNSMEVFIDDFVAKIAEFYPPPSEKNFVSIEPEDNRPASHAHAHGPDGPPVLSDAARAEVPDEPSTTHRKH